MSVHVLADIIALIIIAPFLLRKLYLWIKKVGKW